MLKRLLMLVLLSAAGAAIARDGDKRTPILNAGEIDDSKLTITNDFCGKKQGSITGLVGNSNLKYFWTNAAGTTISTDFITLFNVGAGAYTLHYTNTITNISGIYGPVTVGNDTSPKVDATNVKITPSACNRNDGAITGLKINATGKYIILWTVSYDRATTLTTTDLVNVPPGTYNYTVYDDCSFTSGSYIIPATGAIDLDVSKVIVSNENCGQKDGSITGFILNSTSQNLVMAWTDEYGKVWGNTLDIKNLPSGNYTLSMKYSNLACPKTYGPVRIKNAGAPVIDESKVYMTYANCKCDKGGISGITVTGVGKLTYEWINSNGFIRSDRLDLENAPCETYTLKVTDESGCGPSYSKLYRLTTPPTPNPSPSPDYSKMVVTKGSCNSLGSVTGMRWHATSNYYWMNLKGEILSRSFDLINVPSGTYTFFVTDPCGNSNNIDFDLGPPDEKLQGYTVEVDNICGAATTGAIKILADDGIKKVRWVNASGVDVGDKAEVSGLPVGNYQLYLTNMYGCESLYDSYTIKNLSAPKIISGSGEIIKARCGGKTGGVKNLQITGGVQPYSYSWLNARGDIVGTNADIGGLSAGTYTLVLTDASGCAFANTNYVITNDNSDLPSLIISDVNVCGPGEVTINAGPAIDGYKYRLYTSASSSVPYAEEKSGKLRFNVTTTQTVYISHVAGSCESERTPVNIITNLSGTITNTFSPNGDGINDNWHIEGIELFPKARVTVYSRAGEQVFQSEGYSRPFDGTFRGRQLPTGTYYYVIDTNTGCSARSGNLTIIR